MTEYAVINPATGETLRVSGTAEIFDEAGIPVLLVGDSAGNNVYGFETTVPVTVDHLVPLCRADCAGPSPDRFPTGPADEDVRPADPRWAALDELSFED